jgi:monoamine oxidase
MKIKNLALFYILVCCLFIICLSYDVIIIGAGASGIAAASELTQNGIKVKILEARNRIGGRIYTDFHSFGYPIDHGAIHITRQPDNPIAKLAEFYKINQVSMDRSKLLVILKNNKIIKNALVRMDILKNKFISFCKKNYKKYKNKSIKFILNEFKRKFQFSLLDKILVSQVGPSLNFGLYTPLNDVKEFLFKGAKIWPGDLTMTPDGYIKILEPEARKLDIKFNTTIRSIDQSSLPKKIILTDEAGNKYISDYVILTVPLGYLKKNLIKFSPELSKNKKEAVGKLEFFKMNKIFIEFEEKFWPDADYFSFLVPPLFCHFVGNMSKVYKNSNHNVLLFFIFEDQFDFLKTKTDLEIQEMIILSLKSTFPDYKNKIKIKKYLKTNWNDDPYSYGSFTELAGHEYLRRKKVNF